MMISSPMDRVHGGGIPKVGKCNLSTELCGDARINLPLELSLPADPLKWSRREAQNWLLWLREVNDLEEIDIAHFNVDGEGLCALTQKSIEAALGIRASNIFRATLDLLQSTAVLVRNSPPATHHYPEDTHSYDKLELQTGSKEGELSSKDRNFTQRQYTQYNGVKQELETMSPPAVPKVKEETDNILQAIGYPEMSVTDEPEEISISMNIKTPLSNIPSPQEEEPRDVLSPGTQSLSSESTLEITTDSSRDLPQFQTPGVDEYNRSCVVSDEDMNRLHPVAGPEEEMLDAAHTLAKLERRRSSEGSMEVEEEAIHQAFFTNSKLSDKRLPGNASAVDCGRQGITLWQFILELLADENCKDIVTWTERPLEFKVINSKEIADRWGIRKNRPKMNYDKLSRALRYYYRKNLIQHVPGKRQVYFFVEHPESLDFTQLLNAALATHPLRAGGVRKQSAFTSVNTNSKRRASAPDILAPNKRPRDSEALPLSMLRYHGNIMSPEQHNLMSPKHRKLVSPQQQLVSPQQQLVSPQQQLVSPQQQLVSPQQQMVSPQQLLSMQSPFTQQIPHFINTGVNQDLRQGSASHHCNQHPMVTLETLLSTAASNPALLAASSLMMTPQTSLTTALTTPITPTTSFQTVLDSGLVKKLP